MGPMLSTQTGLNEVQEVLPGFCEEAFAQHRTLHRYWDPVRIARAAPFRSFPSAATKLHDVTLSCVQAWGTTSGRIALGLSGGLDSSILLGCLREMPSNSDVVCFTHFAEGPDSDERQFARLVAERAKCRHIELSRHSDVDLRTVLSQVRLERSPGMRTSQIDRIEPDLALDAGAGAIFKGHGGDELFCRHHTQFYLADLLRSQGPSAEFLGQLTHSAVTEGENLWRSLFRALHHAFVPYRWDVTAILRGDQEDQSLLHPEVVRSVLADGSFELPFVSSTRGCSPGKLWQITLITGRRRYYGPWDRDGDPQSISPLLSQPIIETCLRIPTFMQMRQRRERAVAREAFNREVPREVLERRWKGGTEQLAWKLLQRNLPFVRELLLDGVLARRGLVDRPKLEAALSGGPSSLVRATVPLFELIGMEAWLYAWSGRGVRSMQ
ncbi:MAG: asparagine synthase C-terminal domain-containing protein [Gammaproteobacteria bacterium]